MAELNTRGLRQGFCISQYEAAKLGVNIEDNEYLVIISHDCDLSSSAENEAEYIIGKKIDAPVKDFLSAKHPRKLQIPYTLSNHQEMYVELIASAKHKFYKNINACVDGYLLSDRNKFAFKQWLAARYGRPEYPNAFENCLRKRDGKKTIEQKLNSLICEVSEFLIGVYFDLCGTRETETPDENVYPLRIYLVYDSEHFRGTEISRKNTEHAAANIKNLFESNFSGPQGEDITIDLETCEAISDLHFSMNSLRKMDQWRLEYVSLSSHDPSDFISIGA